MTGWILVDTGPLVALVSPDDEHHVFCTEHSKQLPRTLHTSWPVLTETCYLLRKRPQAVQRILASLRGGLLQCLDLQRDAPDWLSAFFERFGDREPQLADASLVYLAERHAIDRVFTLDRRDFSIYRLSNGRSLTIVPA